MTHVGVRSADRELSVERLELRRADNVVDAARPLAGRVAELLAPTAV
jgi:hypothetical protein